MASPERQHADNTDRVLIRPNACSTFVVRKSSVGHVPHEPSKGAVMAVPVSSSTAAHGGHRTTARTIESKQKQSLSSVCSEHDAVSPVVQKDVVQSSSTSLERGLDGTANSKVVAKSATEDYKADSTHMSCADTGQTLKPVLRLHGSSSPVSFSEVVKDNSDVGLFPGTFLNPTDTVIAKNSVTVSASENVQMLETEVVSLKEQLLVQSKVCLTFIINPTDNSLISVLSLLLSCG